TYTWTVDMEAPVITTDNESGDLGCNPEVMAPMFGATDNCGVGEPIVTTEGPTNDGCAYSQTWTANVTDNCGNQAEAVSITYTWTVDMEAPIITSNSESDDLGCNPDVIIPPLFKADDNCAGEVELEASTEGPTNDGCTYSQTWTANYTDPCGNQAEPVSVTYTWTVDTEAPVITTNGQSGYLGCNPEIVVPEFKVDDNCQDGEMEIEPVTSGPSNDGCSYRQTWTANYTDPCGNVAAELSVTYTWTVDTEAPVITTNGQSGDLGCNPEIVPPLFKAEDNCAGIVDLDPETAGPSNDGCAYSQTWTATYTDPCGNQAEPVSVTYTWTVDSEAPVIEIPEIDPICNGIFPKNVTVNWTDNCSDGGELHAGPTNIVVSECQETADYVFTVTDDCGNTATETLTLTREFNTSGGNCETAFGRSVDNSICFIPDFSRWGWTNYFETEGVYTLEMYAGAAHCDITRGAYAGDVIVTYENGQVTLEFNLDEGYIMNEAHVYVGCNMYPTGNNGSPTVAPGQYNFNPTNMGNMVSNYTVGPIDASGPIYVIAHAVVCEVACRCSESDNDGGQYMPSNYDPVNCGADLTNNEVPEEITFKAHPVPFDNEVFINYVYDFETDVVVEVFDARGVVVRKVANNNYVRGTEGSTRIDLSDTNNQFYFVRLTTSKGTVTKKIVSSSPQRRD
ncbi:hypothetical protein C1T31_08140, partial [Hanstruepera neustonica]